jgi:O-antigen ligase
MQSWRTSILFYCILAMIAGLFLSRAVLSISMMAFVLVSFFHNDIGRQFKNFISSPLLWGMSLLFLVPLISGAWTENKDQWAGMMQIKAPLLALPLAFAAPMFFTQQQWRQLLYFFVAASFIAVCWSLFQYAGNSASVNEAYLKAKSMVTPLENDHVRFSWLVHVAALLCSWIFYIFKRENRRYSWAWLIVAIYFIIYLHLLAARTGLFSFYISLLLLGIYLLIKKTNRNHAFILLLVLVSLPFLAYYLLPSFQNRVKYFQYEIAYGKNASYLPGANDANRIISWKAGWGLMLNDPVKGVGFGDIQAKTVEWYNTHYPGMLESDKIYPSSEWLMYGAGTGIPGMIIFTICMIIPLFIRTRHQLTWLILSITAAFSFIADIGLEVQFGVFIYAFILLWCWKWLNAEKI